MSLIKYGQRKCSRILGNIICGMKSRLISCIFCRCQILASTDLAKYEDHLQVKLVSLDDADRLFYDCSTDNSTVQNKQSPDQGWHNVTVAEELERALQLAGGNHTLFLVI